MWDVPPQGDTHRASLGYEGSIFHTSDPAAPIYQITWNAAGGGPEQERALQQEPAELWALELLWPTSATHTLDGFVLARCPGVCGRIAMASLKFWSQAAYHFK